MPVIQRKGAQSSQGFGEFAQSSTAANYIEDVFSTYLYTGTGAAQTITNGINISTKGGLVWIKSRNNPTDNRLFDTLRGVGIPISSNLTDAQYNTVDTQKTLTSFNGNGFSLGTDSGNWGVNFSSSYTYASWTFRKQAKFFDIQTSSVTTYPTLTTINHNLGSTPGCIMMKQTNASSDWVVWHTSLGNNNLVLNSTVAAGSLYAGYFVNVTSTSFQVYAPGTAGTYVFYIFASNAGGFGSAGTDNVISCGSFTTNSSGIATVTLGYEPQFVIYKSSSSAETWRIMDSMRGMPNLSGTVSTSPTTLYPNTSQAESAYDRFWATSTGFYLDNGAASTTYIYIAIRRGPMKTPTTGTSVLGLNARTGTGANATVTGGQTDDAVLIKNRGANIADLFSARLIGTGYQVTSSTASEVAAGTTILQANPWDVMDGVKVGTTSTITNASANTFINYLFQRAPGFFDVVCYTGTGSATTQTHNLGVVPELMIIKSRTTGTASWGVYAAPLGNTQYLVLETTNNAATSSTYWNNTTPTSSVFTVGSQTVVNKSGDNFIAYLFATLAGVSKVGSYTGTGALLTVNCGFTSGARFVMIKRTDSPGAWYVWDSARGISSGNDPYFLLDTNAAENTTTNYVDTDTTGFKVTAAAPSALNANGGSYIFLAIA